MKIIVAVAKDSPTKTKGDLLENVTAVVLKSQGYEVEQELRKTGSEIDLSCINKANRSKKIYVECKAYDESKKIQADVIKNLFATRSIHGYEEAWLVSTSDLGKEAKGLEEKISTGNDAKSYTFYTPNKLIELMVDLGTIRAASEATLLLSDFKVQNDKLREPILIITEFGYFWLVGREVHGASAGFFFVDAEKMSLINESEFLYALSSLELNIDSMEILVPQTRRGKKEVLVLPPRIQKIGLSSDYAHQINEQKIRFEHPEKTDLVVSDVFMYQDFEIVGAEKYSKINSREISVLQNQRVVVLGDDLSGKTTLAEQMQADLVALGTVSLFLTATEIKDPTFKQLTKLLTKKFKLQYSSEKLLVEAFDALLSSDSQNVSIILDDFESIGMKGEDQVTSFIAMLSEKFCDIRIFSNKSIELELMAKVKLKTALAGFITYRVLPMGHSQRDDLIDKWISIEHQITQEAGWALSKKREMAKKINTAIGANFLPTYPFYILTMLHLFEAGNKSALKGSYAELYRFLINQALMSAHANPEDLDFYHTYLAHFANHFSELDLKSISRSELEAEFDKYCKQMDLNKSFAAVHETLSRSRIIKDEDGTFSFYLNYCLYYFIAKYLADNIEKAESKVRIIGLIENLNKRENASIIIFLVHHSRSQIIIDGIMNQSKQLFPDVPEYSLTLDSLSDINGLLEKEIKRSYINKDPKALRKSELEDRDKIESKPSPNSSESADDIFGQIDLAFETIDVLGQIAHNYYGSLEGKNKADIIEELTSLGLRSLNAFLQEFNEYIDVIRQNVDAELLAKPQKATSNDSRTMTINEAVYSFTQVLILVFLSKPSLSIASKNLFPTVDRILGEKDQPSSRIIALMVHLDFAGELMINKTKILKLYKEFASNYVVKDLLKLEVMRHMYKFELDIKDKQSICQKLGIDFVEANKVAARSTTS